MGLLRPLLEKWIGSAVRSALLALGTYLTAQGWATDGQVTDAIVAITPIVVSVVWSFYDKYSTQVKKEVAKELPANATDTQIKQVIATSTTSENLERALTPAD